MKRESIHWRGEPISKAKRKRVYWQNLRANNIPQSNDIDIKPMKKKLKKKWKTPIRKRGRSASQIAMKIHEERKQKLKSQNREEQEEDKEEEKISSPKPPSHLLLYVDINIRSGQPPIRLPVMSDDSPWALARDFSMAHNIGDEIRSQLEKIFWEKIDLVNRWNKAQVITSISTDVITEVDVQ